MLCYVMLCYVILYCIMCLLLCAYRCVWLQLLVCVCVCVCEWLWVFLCTCISGLDKVKLRWSDLTSHSSSIAPSCIIPILSQEKCSPVVADWTTSSKCMCLCLHQHSLFFPELIHFSSSAPQVASMAKIVQVLLLILREVQALLLLVVWMGVVCLCLT